MELVGVGEPLRPGPLSNTEDPDNQRLKQIYIYTAPNPPVLVRVYHSSYTLLGLGAGGGGGEEAVPLQAPVDTRPVTVSKSINYCVVNKIRSQLRIF